MATRIDKSNDVNQIVGENVLRQRQKLGLSHEELGKMLGVSPQQIIKYETGIDSIDPVKLVQLARLFQCSLDFLCSFETLLVSAPSEMNFLDRSDFKKTQELIRHFITIESSELRNVACNLVHGLACISLSKPN